MKDLPPGAKVVVTEMYDMDDGARRVRVEQVAGASLGWLTFISKVPRLRRDCSGIGPRLQRGLQREGGAEGRGRARVLWARVRATLARWGRVGLGLGSPSLM
eukprot:413839-Prymnesium_polylepis.1